VVVGGIVYGPNARPVLLSLSLYLRVLYVIIELSPGIPPYQPHQSALHLKEAENDDLNIDNSESQVVETVEIGLDEHQYTGDIRRPGYANDHRHEIEKRCKQYDKECDGYVSIFHTRN
jgi:hypothetical protein